MPSPGTFEISAGSGEGGGFKDSGDCTKTVTVRVFRRSGWALGEREFQNFKSVGS